MAVTVCREVLRLHNLYNCWETIASIEQLVKDFCGPVPDLCYNLLMSS